MATINVQFSDAAESEIVSYFAGPQDPEIYPYQSTIDTDDARWKVFFENNPALQPFLPAPN